jgi:hypothetical protein
MAPSDLLVFKFMKGFAFGITMGKSPWVGDIPKTWGQIWLFWGCLGPLYLGHPYARALPHTKHCFRKTKHLSTTDQYFDTCQDIKLSSEMGSYFAEKPLTSLTVTHVAHTAFHFPTCRPPSCQAFFHILCGPCTCVDWNSQPSQLFNDRLSAGHRPPNKLLKQSTVWSQLQVTLNRYWLLQINYLAKRKWLEIDKLLQSMAKKKFDYCCSTFMVQRLSHVSFYWLVL